MSALSSIMTEHQRWKDERLCIISTVFNWHSTSVSSTEFNTELNTICTVRDSTISTDNSTDGLTIRLAIQLYNSALQVSFQFALTIPFYNSAYNSALQIRLQFVLTISCDEFVLTIRLTIALQFWLTKMGETIRASEQRLYRGPKGVSCAEAFAGGR